MSELAPAKDPQPPVSGPLAAFERWLYDMLVVRAPFQLPKGFTDWVVQYGPWITLVLSILMLPALFAILGAASLTGVLATTVGVVVGPAYWLGLIVLVAQVAIMFASIPMLLKRQRNGWMLLFYANLLSIAYGVVNAFGYGVFAISSLIGTAIGAVIGLYILFQIRSYYTK